MCIYIYIHVYSMLQCIYLGGILAVLQRAAVCCSVLQCVAVQCAAVHIPRRNTSGVAA